MIHFVSFLMGITDIEFIRILMFKCLADLTGNSDIDGDNIKLIIRHYNEDLDDNLVVSFINSQSILDLLLKKRS